MALFETGSTNPNSLKDALMHVLSVLDTTTRAIDDVTREEFVEVLVAALVRGSVESLNGALATFVERTEQDRARVVAESLTHGVRLVLAPPERVARLATWLEREHEAAELLLLADGEPASDTHGAAVGVDVFWRDVLESRGLVTTTPGGDSLHRTPLGEDVRSVLMLTTPSLFSAR